MKLIVDNVLVSSIKSFSYDSEKDVLDVTAVGEVVIPEPEEPKPVEPKPDPAPVPAGVVVAYPIKDITNQQLQRLEIPANKILASKFTAPKTGYGAIQFQTPSGQPGVDTRVWISETPGGKALPGPSDRAWSFIYDIKWTVDGSTRNKAVLKAGQDYYVNLQHYPELTHTTDIERTAQ